MKRASKSASENQRGDLSVREELFLTEYIKSGGNGTQAVLRAGLTDNPHSARVIANRLLTNVSILQRLNEWRESIQIEQREALGRLAQIACGSLEDFFTVDEKGRVSHDFRGAYEGGSMSNLKRLDTTVSTHTTGDGASEEVTRTEIEMHSPLDAIKLLSRILGWEKQPQQNPSESALVLSYVRKAAEIQKKLIEEAGQFVELGQIIRLILDTRPDLLRDEPALRRAGLIADRVCEQTDNSTRKEI